MRDYLRSHGINPTATRVRVLNYLDGNTDHPTAEAVFNGLKKRKEKISRATVYNTLHLFYEKGIVRAIKGTDDTIHFDPDMTPHAHFQCSSCHKIWDLPIDEFPISFKSCPELNNSKISSISVLIKGVCPDCLEKTL